MLINNLNNVILNNLAVGEDEATLKMLVESLDGETLGGASRILKNDSQGITVEIKTVKIDDVISKDRNISIIQLDIEGFEKEGLKGALETISRCNPILILEDNNNVIKTSWYAKNPLPRGSEITGKIHSNTVLKSKNAL